MRQLRASDGDLLRLTRYSPHLETDFLARLVFANCGLHRSDIQIGSDLLIVDCDDAISFTQTNTGCDTIASRWSNPYAA